MDQSRPNLLAVSAAIEADASLTSARRGAIRSAINTLCRIMDMTPATVPAHLDFIRRKLQLVGTGSGRQMLAQDAGGAVGEHDELRMYKHI